MGLTYVELEVGNPANPNITEKVKFLVDSGAIYGSQVGTSEAPH